MDSREVKALEITGDVRISFTAGAWHVQSQTSSMRYTCDVREPPVMDLDIRRFAWTGEHACPGSLG
jgi:hypothetical protein